MKCDIWPDQARERSKYCALCADHVMSVPEGRARVSALKRARREDGFHCEWCSGDLQGPERRRGFRERLIPAAGRSSADF